MNMMTSTAESSLHEADIPLGAHLVTPRRGYTHHGIYIGGGEVVHYLGLSTTLRRGPVAKVTLAQFASGHAVSVQTESGAAYTPIEIVKRAQSRLGEDCYSVMNNNCEHLCAWCVHGVARSSQVDRFVGWLRRMVQAARSLVTLQPQSTLAQAA